jgi:dTDP-4-dehydrorhamnose 3,5-epimerase
MNVVQTSISDVLILEPRVFADSRGFFFESFSQQVFEAAVGGPVSFVQDNHSRSTKGVLRGLHYQVEHPQGKLVRAVAGAVFDVAVDIRPDSPTFGRWAGVELTAENKRQIWVPPGLAHGFLVLSDTAEVLYKTTDYYHPEHERCILWSDPTLAIQWPLEAPLILSAKDAAGQLLPQGTAEDHERQRPRPVERPVVSEK